eukprot:8196752-Heterocapsa_arctica.AAC.1
MRSTRSALDFSGRTCASSLDSSESWPTTFESVEGLSPLSGPVTVPYGRRVPCNTSSTSSTSPS